MQPYFSAANYPDNLPDVWESHTGWITSSTDRAVVLGEWGAPYKSTQDRQWMDTFISWLVLKALPQGFYWCLNVDSFGTDGVLTSWGPLSTDNAKVEALSVFPSTNILDVYGGGGGGGGGGSTSPAPQSTATAKGTPNGNQTPLKSPTRSRPPAATRPPANSERVSISTSTVCYCSTCDTVIQVTVTNQGTSELASGVHNLVVELAGGTSLAGTPPTLGYNYVTSATAGQTGSFVISQALWYLSPGTAGTFGINIQCSSCPCSAPVVRQATSADAFDLTLPAPAPATTASSGPSSMMVVGTVSGIAAAVFVVGAVSAGLAVKYARKKSSTTNVVYVRPRQFLA
mmetsp:Transcript_16394/g.27072  ORF Transcript_16394/g.27072 Transcript_16394/m.27072 type:complete len:343 (+) Transcript_16394:195-1223(+)